VRKRLFKKIIKSERGAAFLEFAVVAPFLIFLVMGIIEFGWIFNGYIIVTGAAREGGRLAIMGQEFSVIEEAVERHAAFFTDVQGGSIKVKPLANDYPDPNYYPVDGMITIQVEAAIPVLIGFYIDDDNDPFPLSAEVSVKRAY